MELTSIAFIPDGNRRYAQKQGIDLVKAYQLGTQKAWDVLDWLKDYPKIKTGTFYTLSFENLTRSLQEKIVLFRIFEKELEKVFSTTRFVDDQVRLRIIGRIEALPKKLKEKIFKAEEATRDFKKKTVNLAIGYNGRIEIVDAVKKILREKEYNTRPGDLDEETFKKYLYSDFPDPDMLIRTSGTKRLSAFLTYQTVYSELYFLDKLWPEIEKTDLDLAIMEYNDRERRFGK